MVIDSTIGGRARGGLRLLPDVSAAELRALARTMTLKYGFLGLPQGGAKAGVVGDPEAPLGERRRLLGEFARAIAPLLERREYLPGPDMGTDASDIRHALESAGVRVGAQDLGSVRSGDYTAQTVVASALVALRRRGISAAGASAAIEGFGSVGQAVARRLAAAGVGIVAVSTSRGAILDRRGLDVGRLVAAASQSRSAVVERFPEPERIAAPALLELPVDLLVPCARLESIHQGNVARIAARVVCAGANNPVTQAAETALWQRGVLCLPDFVTSSGGVLGGTMEFAGIDPARIDGFVEGTFGARVDALIARSDSLRVPPREVVEPLALARFDEVRRAADRPNPAQRLFRAGLAVHRRGWSPRRLVARLAMRYFAASLVQIG
ncbi:MAG TPA: Glu/Leu/Phe/Val dehydrogenase dimerization domain-containing protein [Candidatus Bathyarchaeia archaeon]|nr:Glu/Leu/Phe/Val dehydrogenase dimerization domain-containing protein [Candidatus Bathyarchaeia archaeon]